MLIDSHCHLDGKAFDHDRDETLERARAAGVRGFLAVGTGDGPPDLEAGLRLAEYYDDVVASVGVHPHDAAKAGNDTLDQILALCDRPHCVAVGEIGLDYHYDFSPRAQQKSVFVGQLGVAHQKRKPILIHTREAWDDTLDLLQKNWATTGLGGVMHCFSGDYDQARACLEMGFHISFAGILTFGRSEQLRDVARRIPLDRILVETDAPYLTPEPHRKIRRNEPRFVVETARRLASVRGEDFEKTAAATTANFRRLFSLPA